jgi:molecular chaperone DnaK (HSP70)
MGLTQSKKNDEICSIQDRLKRLEMMADLNKDGITSKEELAQYTSTELHLRDTEILTLKNDKLALQEQLKKTKENLDKLQKAYDNLHNRHKVYVETVDKTTDINPIKPIRISETTIEKYVDDLLADPNINIYYMPDKIEKPIYMNTLKMLLSILQKSLNHINIDLIGHELKVVIEPQMP